MGELVWFVRGLYGLLDIGKVFLRFHWSQLRVDGLIQLLNKVFLLCFLFLFIGFD